MKRNETNAFGVKENVPGVDVATLLKRSLSETKQKNRELCIGRFYSLE